jgi:hypothetical protein
MASGIARSPWLPDLARELGWSRARLYALFERHGYGSPYLDKSRALKILAKERIPVPSTPSKLLAKKEVANVRVAPGQKKKQPAPQAIEKMKRAWAMKLVPRLARLLPEGDTDKGKARVKKILRAGGYAGPRWDDEARALNIFMTAGFPIEGFEYANGGPKQGIVVATQPDQVSVVLRPQPRVTTIDPEDAKRLQRVFNLLNAYEHQVMELVRNRQLSKLAAPLDIPITALNELRSHLKAS